MTQFYCWVLPDFAATYKPKWRSAMCLIGPPLLPNESLKLFGKYFVGVYSTSFQICPADPRGVSIIIVVALTSQIKKDLFLQCKLFWQELFGQYLCSPKMLWQYKQKKKKICLLSHYHTLVWLACLCPLISFTESRWVTMILFDVLANTARPERWL